MYRFKQTKIFNFYMMNGTINKYLIAEIICNTFCCHTHIHTVNIQNPTN